MKFGRTYKLVIYHPTSSLNSAEANSPVPDLEIAFPITIRFQLINRYTMSANRAHFLIYNLGEKTRSTIYRDVFDLNDNYRDLVFSAGYESEPTMPIAFKGQIQWAYSYRQGPDWVTEIEAFDGYRAIQKSQVSMQVDAGYNLKELLGQMVATMTSVKKGKIGAFDVASSRGRVLSGNTWDLIGKIIYPLNAEAFINNGVVHIVNQDEYIADVGGIKEISSDTGLIDTPRREGTKLKATMIFEPRLQVGQIVRLKSDEPSVQIALGKYGDGKVADVSHAGTISGSVCGDALTTVTFFLARRPLVAA